MKRQTQVLGVRNWYGDAFVSLQEEPLKVIDGFFSQYGAFVLSGCEVKANGSKYDIAPGLVVLEGSGADNATVKVVVPFARDYCDSPCPSTSHWATRPKRMSTTMATSSPSPTSTRLWQQP